MINCAQRSSSPWLFLPLLALSTILLVSLPLLAQETEQSVEPMPLAPPTDLQANDTPNDEGGSITLSWKPSADDTPEGRVTGYRIVRSKERDRGFVIIDSVDAGEVGFEDRAQEAVGEVVHSVEDGVGYFYRVEAKGEGLTASSQVVGPVVSEAQWFHTGKVPVLVGMLIFFVLVWTFVGKARRRAGEIFVRPIAGIEAIDEAVGRATEMGRPILYLLGLGTAAEIATIASFTILSRVAKKVAQYQTRLIVPCNEAIVMTIAQETVRAAYMDAGRPDLYNKDDVFFVTSMQFPFAAAVNGIMLRERTATNLYFGVFFAESLLLAETGNIAGSIQIAGTNEVAQLPFFITACDYTLIGEELYAASAYLGKEPLLLGALKAQDWVKGIVMFLLVTGAILISFGTPWIRTLVTVVQ